MRISPRPRHQNRRTRSFDLVSKFGADFEEFQREAEARSFGSDLYREASAISEEAVAAVSAVLMAVIRKSRGRLPVEVASEYAWQMMAESAIDHYEAVNPKLPLELTDWDA